MATQVSKETVAVLVREINAALKVVGERHGMDIKVGHTTYDPPGNSFRSRLEAQGAVEGGISERARKDWEQAVAIVGGLKAEWLGKSFTRSGITYTVTGYNWRGRKRPVCTTSQDGREFRWEVGGIISLMGGRGALMAYDKERTPMVTINTKAATSLLGRTPPTSGV